MDANEDFVRKHWETVHDSDYGVDIVIGLARTRFGGLHDRWISAAAFTHQRLREVAEMDEEIHMLQGLCALLRYEPGDQTAPIYKRTITRLQSIRAELTRGLREQVTTQASNGGAQ